MPNWTTNGIACPKEALGLFVNGEGLVDFEMVRPMPKSLEIVSGSITRDAVDAYNGKDVTFHAMRADLEYGTNLPFDIETIDDLKLLGAMYLVNEKLYGAKTWYDWCCDNWGTKWNACNTDVVECGDLAIVTFDTAWAAPDVRMFDELFAKSPYLYYAESFDEDYGGIYSWHGGGGGLIFKEAVHEEDDDGDGWTWTSGEYDPDVEEIERKVLR